jgi:site-specific recombinase XerD
MKLFNSFLAPQLNAFLHYWQEKGHTIRTYQYYLLAFDGYLTEKEADWASFQPAFFLQMIADITHTPNHANKFLLTIRTFFQFLLRRAYLNENPLKDIPYLKQHPSVPFVFSSEQTNQLLAAVCRRIRKKQGFFLRDLGIYLAIILLARCGLRISEPLRLCRHHYRRDEATLYIEKTKFNKDRLIPIPKTVVEEIENYLAVRHCLQPDDENPYLIAGKGQKPLRDNQVRYVFHQAIKDIGLQQPRKVMGTMNFNPPRPHSLRHSFAINTLNTIKERGESRKYALPVLAAFLGHSHFKCSSVYLKVSDAKSRQDLYDFTIWQEWKR